MNIEKTLFKIAISGGLFSLLMYFLFLYDHSSQIHFSSARILFPILGIVALLIGIIGLIDTKRKEKLKKVLKQFGMKINAKFTNIYMSKIYINGVNPFFIICEWRDSIGKTLSFKSKRLWFNPTDYIVDNNIETFTVYLDPKNNKRYIVEVDYLIDMHNEKMHNEYMNRKNNR